MTTWGQVGSDIESTYSDGFGMSVSLSHDGTRMAVGVPNSDLDSSDGTGEGSVRMFELSSGTWTQLGNTLSSAVNYENFGSSVSMSGDGTRVVIGAPQYDPAPSSGRAMQYDGRVRVYEYAAGAWTLMNGGDIAAPASTAYFGDRVVISGDGATIATTSRQPSCSVLIYRYSSGAWSQIGSTFTTVSTSTACSAGYYGFTSNFGLAFSNDGSIFAFGEGFYSSSTGRVTVHTYSSASGWTQRGAALSMSSG